MHSGLLSCNTRSESGHGKNCMHMSPVCKVCCVGVVSLLLLHESLPALPQDIIYHKFRIQELQKCLTRLGLRKTGCKSELQIRLLGYSEDASSL